MKKRLKAGAYVVGILSIVINFYLWLRILFMERNSTEQEVIMNLSILIIPPTVLAIFALLLKKNWIMYTAFICAIPIGLYFLANNGVWQLFGSLQILFLISAVLTTFALRQNKTNRL